MWLRPRRALTDVKGKGMMQTYWLGFKTSSSESIVSSDVLETTLLSPKSPEEAMASYSREDIAAAKSEKLSRLIDWNVEVLSGLLRKVVAGRGEGFTINKAAYCLKHPDTNPGATIFDEVKEVIPLPSHLTSMSRIDRVECTS